MDKIIELLIFSNMGLVAIGAILFSKNPKRFILGMIFVTAPWQGGYWLPFIQTDVRFAHVLSIILFIYSLVRPSKIGRKDPFIRSIFIPMIGMIGCAFFAAVQAQDPALAFGGVFTLTMDYLLLICILGAIEKPQDIVYLLHFLFAAVSFQIGLALLQYRIPYYKLGIIDVESSYYLWWRMHGTFGHPNQLGMFLMFVLPFLFRYLIIVVRYNKIKTTVVVLMIFLLSAFSLYTTQNRGSETALVVGMLITMWIDMFRRKVKIRRTLVKVTLIILAFGSLAMIRYGGRLYDQFFNQPRDIYDMAEARALLNQEAMPRVFDNLPFGVGMGNYESGFWRETMVHNLYLLITAEIGIGFIFFVWIIFVFFYEAIKLIRVGNFFISNLGSAFLATLIGFLISSWVGPDWFLSNQVRMSFWIICGMILSANRLWIRMEKLNQLSRKKQFLERNGGSDKNDVDHIRSYD